MISSKFGKKLSVKYAITTALSVTIGLAITAISQEIFGNVKTYMTIMVLLFIMYMLITIMDKGGDIANKISKMIDDSHRRKKEIMELEMKYNDKVQSI